jgi:hypothetical protein
MFRSDKVGMLLLIALMVATVASTADAGSKRLMSVNAAKLSAERALVETVYGLKLRATEEVEDLVSAKYEGKSEAKTSTMIKGIQYDEILYDSKKDIAKVTAYVRLSQIENINGDVVNLNNRVLSRVGFGTSSPASARALKALRAAEIDAYKQLMKRLLGYTLESRSTVENYMLTSDLIRTKVMATLFMADLKDFGWADNGDAYMKMTLNVAEVSQMIGQRLTDDSGVIEVEGWGAQEDDFKAAKKKK